MTRAIVCAILKHATQNAHRHEASGLTIEVRSGLIVKTGRGAAAVLELVEAALEMAGKKKGYSQV
jgi:hypothetical protein